MRKFLINVSFTSANRLFPHKEGEIIKSSTSFDVSYPILPKIPKLKDQQIAIIIELSPEENDFLPKIIEKIEELNYIVSNNEIYYEKLSNEVISQYGIEFSFKIKSKNPKTIRFTAQQLT